MEDVEELYARAARADQERWVRKHVGTQGPVSTQEREQALGDLFDRWAADSIAEQ